MPTYAPVELIEYEDIASHKGGEWSDSPASGGTWTMYCAGWVTDEDETSVTVHSTIGDPRRSPCYGHDTVIPKGAITRRLVLRKHWA